MKDAEDRQLSDGANYPKEIRNSCCTCIKSGNIIIYYPVFLTSVNNYRFTLIRTIHHERCEIQGRMRIFITFPLRYRCTSNGTSIFIMVMSYVSVSDVPSAGHVATTRGRVRSGLVI